ncbi:MAG: rod shape-determining protein MreC [Candidatus Magnetoovum sp. WYHC-5]|nr:rod shape-determining protein MreC [Candidatus Magnetoovum sp. WYHC-5]
MKVKKQALFFIYMFFIIALMTYQSIKGPLRPLFYTTYPLHYINDTINGLYKAVKAPFDAMFALRDENEKLKAELNELKLKEQLFNETIKENKRLTDIVEFREKELIDLTVSKVIMKNPDSWSHMLIVDKGLSYGIRKDMAVRTIEGLLGKVKTVDRDYSTILLITDTSFSVAVRLQDGRIQGILIGTGMDICEVKYIPYEEEVSIGQKVITSGIDGLFPSGIPIGEVVSATKDPTSLFLTVKVKLYVTPEKVEEVMILTDSHDYIH